MTDRELKTVLLAASMSTIDKDKDTTSVCRDQFETAASLGFAEFVQMETSGNAVRLTNRGSEKLNELRG